MIILRIFLYTICIVSISWSALVFAGPAVIKRIVLKYTDGALVTSNISVSPALDIAIGRIDFQIVRSGSEAPISGFLRSTEISWSFWDDQPFLTVDFGPTVIKDILTADNVRVNTPSYQDLVWQDLFFSAEVAGLNINSHAEFFEFNLQGFYNHRSSLLNKIRFEAKNTSLHGWLPSSSVSLITGVLDQAYLNVKLDEQSVSGSFSANEVFVFQPEFKADDISGEFQLTEVGSNFELELLRLELEESGSFINNVGIGGNYDKNGLIKNLQIDLKNGKIATGSPSFSHIEGNVFNINGADFEVTINGAMDEFEIYSLDTFVGVLPATIFNGELQIDGERSGLITTTSQINFYTSTTSEIYGTAKIALKSRRLTDLLQCLSKECDASEMYFDYVVNFDDEWAKGQSACPVTPCNFEVMAHSLLTSNTTKILTKINQVGLLTPLSSLYLYSLISNGESIDGGHQLKF